MPGFQLQFHFTSENLTLCIKQNSLWHFLTYILTDLLFETFLRESFHWQNKVIKILIYCYSFPTVIPVIVISFHCK